jgi:hypothetical protein
MAMQLLRQQGRRIRIVSVDRIASDHLNEITHDIELAKLRQMVRKVFNNLPPLANVVGLPFRVIFGNRDRSG